MGNAAPPSQKVVMLDVIHPRRGLEETPTSVEALLKNVPRPKSTVVFLAPVEHLTGGFNKVQFVRYAAGGLKGPADADRDLVITSAEWANYLTDGTSGVSVWPK